MDPQGIYFLYFFKLSFMLIFIPYGNPDHSSSLLLCLKFPGMILIRVLSTQKPAPKPCFPEASCSMLKTAQTKAFPCPAALACAVLLYAVL